MIEMDSEGKRSPESVRNRGLSLETAAATIRVESSMVWKDDIGYSAWMVTRLVLCSLGR